MEKLPPDLMMGQSTTIHLSMAAIQQNVAAILGCLQPKTKLMAVVKANGYGHGIVQAAIAALKAGAAWLGVARVREGLILRAQGIKAPILILGAALQKECEQAVVNGLTLAVTHEDQIHWLGEAARKHTLQAAVHLKVDTGMNRIGAKTDKALLSLYNLSLQYPEIAVTGAFTHFSKADEDKALTQSQLHSFLEITKKVLPQNILLHCANSAATLSLPNSHLDMVRVGIALYGCPPVKTNVALVPALAWKAPVTYIKTLTAGEAISYGGTYITDRQAKIATLALGYGDGYPRCLSNEGQVLLGGRRANIVGRICMDQMMVDVTGIKNVNIGDEAVLIGRQGQEQISAEELARWAGTISYEILLSPTQRVERRYDE